MKSSIPGLVHIVKKVSLFQIKIILKKISIVRANFESTPKQYKCKNSLFSILQLIDVGSKS